MSFSLTGIASGLDTESIISQLMEIERTPYIKLEAKKNTYNEQMSVFRTINTKLAALRTAVADLRLSTNFNVYSAAVSDEKVLKVTASDQAAAASYNIYVQQLARQHSITSVEFSKDDLKGSMEDYLGADGSKTFKIHANGETFEFELKGDTLEEALNNLAREINGKNTGLTATLVETNPGAKTLMVTAKQSGLDHSIELWNPDPEAGTEVDPEGDQSGKNTPPNDGHIYLEGLDLLMKIGLVNIKPPSSDGDAAENSHDESAGDSLAPSASATYELNTLVHAQNAILTINGLEVVSNSNEISNVMNGISITLLKENETATITVSRDVNKVAEKVEAFVKAYNDVITTIRSNTAKGADLQGDFTMRTLEEQLFGLINGKVGSDTSGLEYQYLFSIGLEVDRGVTKGSDMTGTLSFDKDAFKKAFEENPDAVYKLFAYSGNTEGEPSGVAERLYASLRDWTRSGTGIIAAKIDGYTKQIDYIAQQMEAMEERLSMRETLLRKQFANMEIALKTLQNEMTWLSSQISALTASSY